MERPTGFFLVTVDVEGDNLWSKPVKITTRNARHLPRFQELCECQGLEPVYLCNYEMAGDPAFLELGQDVVKRRTAEIGMHLHAWNSPPLIPLTENDHRYSTYLVDYPETVMRQKIAFMTDLLRQTYQTEIVSHRAGRWAFNETYALMLMESGYLVDCSVTPYISWRTHEGAPGGAGGSDYSSFPDQAYFIGAHDIARPGSSSLLEVPVTVIQTRNKEGMSFFKRLDDNNFVKRAMNRMFPSALMLRPNGRNLRRLMQIVGQCAREKRPYVQFFIHSSELMPGGSPTFPRQRDIDKLYADLEVLFHYSSQFFIGGTLAGFYEHHQASSLQ